MADATTQGAGAALLTFLSAWNEADAEARRATLEEALAASSSYLDPNAPEPLEGPDGVAGFLDVFRRSLPDAVLVPQGTPLESHGSALIHARIDRAGAAFARLVFVGQMGADGLVRVTGFVEGE